MEGNRDERSVGSHAGSSYIIVIDYTQCVSCSYN